MSDFFMPERSNSFSVTSTGPVSIIAGSEPILAKARILARAFIPIFFAGFLAAEQHRTGARRRCRTSCRRGARS